MQLAPIAQLGRYEVLRHLATGGMADVYLARTSGLQGFSRHVVVKRIRAEFVKDPRFVRMFLDEARLAATLHHHNVVQVYDVGQEAGEYFFAMEYVHGEDLRHILGVVSKRKERLPLEHALTIVQGAAAGLDHAHNRCNTDGRPLNIVHRDVSPSNVLVGYDGGIKLVDFGIAKANIGPGETQTGTLKGKISYLSPEQIRGGALDRRSDVFSLGIVLFELTTTRKLFRAKTEFETMRQIIAGEIPRPGQVVSGYPPALEQIVIRALTIDPAARYASAAELLQDLERFAAGASLSLSPIALGRWITELCGARPEPWNMPAANMPAVVHTDDAWTMLECAMPAAARAAGFPSPPQPHAPGTEPAERVALSTPRPSTAQPIVADDLSLSMDELPMPEPAPRPAGRSQPLTGAAMPTARGKGNSTVRGGRSRRQRQQAIMLISIVLTGIALVLGALLLRTEAPRTGPAAESTTSGPGETSAAPKESAAPR